MRLLRSLETRMGHIFTKAPTLPDSSREALVDLWPWIALIFGVLQLLAAGVLVRLLRLTATVGPISGALVISGTERVAIYVGIAVLIIDAVILLLAFPKLRWRSRRGWELLFLGSLLNFGYTIISFFIHSRGILPAVFGLLGSVVGFYLLYQVRGAYKATAAASKRGSSVR